MARGEGRSATAEAVSGDGLLRIGEAALRLGVSERALRYYEELGLVVPAHHSPGGNRRYGEAELARVRRIRELQDLMGLNLDEIRTVLSSEDRLEDLRARWQASDDAGERREVLEEVIALTGPLREQVEGKRDRLEAFLGELDEKMARYRALLDELEETARPLSAARRRAGRQPSPTARS